MAANGSRGPRPYAQHRASTVFLRVPRAEWPAVKRGHKREFRAGNGDKQVVQLWGVPLPTLAVAYCVTPRGHDHKLMVLEKAWQEPLGAISPESLAEEGCSSLAEFRQRWMAREHRRFRPTRLVWVYRVREADDRDLAPIASRLVDHLYGEFLDGI